MLLTELAEAVTSHLNADKDSWNQTTDSDGSILAKTELDPDKCLLPKLGVYIVPVLTEWVTDKSNNRRSSPQGIWKAMTIMLIVSRVFEEIPKDSTDGVANWSEAKRIIDTREAAEKRVLGYSNSELRLAAVEPQEIEEIEIDNRNFVALTTFTYETMEKVP